MFKSIALAASMIVAGQLVDQGQPGRQGPWPVYCVTFADGGGGCGGSGGASLWADGGPQDTDGGPIGNGGDITPNPAARLYTPNGFDETVDVSDDLTLYSCSLDAHAESGLGGDLSCSSGNGDSITVQAGDNLDNVANNKPGLIASFNSFVSTLFWDGTQWIVSDNYFTEPPNKDVWMHWGYANDGGNKDPFATQGQLANVYNYLPALNLPSLSSYVGTSPNSNGNVDLEKAADGTYEFTAYTTSTGVEVTELVSQPLDAGMAWSVTMVGKIQGILNQGYPDFGVVVSTAIDGGSAYETSVYNHSGMWSTGASEFTPGGARIGSSLYNYDNEPLWFMGGGTSFVAARLFNDGTYLHFQVSSDAGEHWSDIYCTASIAGLNAYGAGLGQDYASGSPSYVHAWLIQNTYANYTPADGVHTINISGVSVASPAVITTSAAHGLISGDLVSIHGVTGATNVNTPTAGINLSCDYVVKVLSPTTFTVWNPNTNAFINNASTYTGGGTIFRLSR